MINTLHFKSNIHCEECVKKVSPFLDALTSVYKWSVDFSKPEKVLTVTGENLHASSIKKAIRKAGYRIDPADSFLSRIFSSFRKSYEKDCCKH